MHDDDTHTTRGPAPEGGAASPDEEPFGDLSKAARDAVRQPADPRLEAQIARLGLASEAAPPRRARGRRAEAEAVDPGDAERIVESLAATQSATDRLGRRVERLTYVLVGLAVILTILVVVLVVRATT
jgi:hypothetical protein